MTLLSTRSQSSAPPRAVSRPARSPWAWMLAACVLLGVSGAGRYWREWQFSTLAANAREAPFPLKELPRTLNGWVSLPSGDGRLDPDTARIAGSSDHVVRSYVNEKSGEEINVLVLYGLASHVFGHTPKVCYPAVGYQLVQGPTIREFQVAGLKTPVRFESATYMKRSGGTGIYEEVYYTFYNNGEWVPDAASRWKTFRYHPGMYKIQISRVVSGLSDEVHAPSEDLLRAFVQEILARSGVGATKPALVTGPSSARTGQHAPPR